MLSSPEVHPRSPVPSVFFLVGDIPIPVNFVGCSYVEIKSSRFQSGRVNRKISDCCAVICFSNRRIVPSDCSAPPGPRGKGGGAFIDPHCCRSSRLCAKQEAVIARHRVAFGEPDDRLREAIHGAASAAGLLRRFAPRNDAAIATQHIVIPAKAGIQSPRLIESITAVSVRDHPPSRVTTVECEAAFSRR